jgi:hypothetical protein
VKKEVMRSFLGKKQETHWRHTEEIRANDAEAFRFCSFPPVFLLVNPAGIDRWILS